MKKPELFHKTVGILVNAYLNDTLQHNNCWACAVGNIVAGNMGLKIEKHNFYMCEEPYRDYQIYGIPYYNTLTAGILATRNFSTKEIKTINLTEAQLEQAKATEYTIEELNRIEVVFENADRYYIDDINNEFYDEWMYNGLMAVVDYLIEIHQGTQEESKEAKKLFVKAEI